MSETVSPRKPARREVSPMRRALTAGTINGVILGISALFQHEGGRTLDSRVGFVVVFTLGVVAISAAFTVLRALSPNDGKLTNVMLVLLVVFFQHNHAHHGDWTSWLLYAGPGMVLFGCLVDWLSEEGRKIRHEREAAEAKSAGRTVADLRS